MIHNFKKWSLIESFGNGIETFTQELEMYGKLRNLTFYNHPSSWGEEITSATGKITYTAELDVNRAGIEDIVFAVQSLELEIEMQNYDEDGNEEEPVYKTFSVEKNEIPDVKIEVEGLPFFVRELEIDFLQAENIDGEVDPMKIEYTLMIGYDEK